VAGGKVVKNSNFMVLRGKHLCHVGADISGPAADEYVHSLKVRL